MPIIDNLPKVTLNLRVPTELKQRLEAEAARQYVKPATLARVLIARGLESGVTARRGDVPRTKAENEVTSDE